MTPSDIERMAREAGAFTPGARRNYWAVTEPALERLAQLVRAQALEDAAKVCDFHALTDHTGYGIAEDCAAAIRALAAAPSQSADRAEP